MHKLIAAFLLVFRMAFAACPDPEVLKLLRERIAFERTWAEPSFKGIRVIHVDVSNSGPTTGFYFRDPPRIRGTSYTFVGNDGPRDGGSCQTTIDLRSIPAWRPSPNNQAKKQAAEQMRREIEAWYPDATEIVARDFNLLDHDITFYARTRDQDYYQGFSYYADKVPHCEGWHLFGMAPLSGIRKWIFAQPYRLK